FLLVLVCSMLLAVGGGTIFPLVSVLGISSRKRGRRVKVPKLPQVVHASAKESLESQQTKQTSTPEPQQTKKSYVAIRRNSKLTPWFLVKSFFISLFDPTCQDFLSEELKKSRQQTPTTEYVYLWSSHCIANV